MTFIIKELRMRRSLGKLSALMNYVAKMVQGVLRRKKVAIFVLSD